MSNPVSPSSSVAPQSENRSQRTTWLIIGLIVLALVVFHLPEIPAGLPASLLSRRPDVAEAELKLIAANAQVGGATASFYPTLSLTGAAGFENLNVNQWSPENAPVGAK